MSGKKARRAGKNLQIKNSTAKLRTFTHYLELIAELHKELAPLDADGLKAKAQQARDPLTKWAVETLQKEKTITLESFPDLAMKRKYSARPWETFSLPAAAFIISKTLNQRIISSVWEQIPQQLSLARRAPNGDAGH